MKKLLENSAKFYTPKKRPSGHDISKSFATDNGGAIPSNLLQIPNTDSNSQYLSCCKMLNIRAHPARFPSALPEFFIKFLTNEDDLVLDIFAGSNTTGWIAERLNRNWIAFELEHTYLASSAFRFLPIFENGETQNLFLLTRPPIMCNNSAGVKTLAHYL